MDDRKIVIDCDPGTDDALALMLASVYLREHVLCLLSTYGNASSENTYSNLLGLSELLHLRGIPVIQGESCPLEKEGFVPTDYHGENGLCGIVLRRSAVPVDENDGIDSVYRLMKAAGKVVYVALGPLTNLAVLLERYPDAADLISEAVIMGGGLAFGNTECGAEYNFSLDPVAVTAVLHSRVEKVLAPLDLTHTLAFCESDVEEIVGLQRDGLTEDVTSAHHVFGQILYRNLDSSLENGNEGAIIHDGATIAYLCGCCECLVKRIGLRSDEVGRIYEDEEGYPVGVISEMSRGALISLMKEAFGFLRS